MSFGSAIQGLMGGMRNPNMMGGMGGMPNQMMSGYASHDGQQMGGMGGMLGWLQNNPELVAQILSGAGQAFGGIQERKLQRDMLNEERRQFNADDAFRRRGMGVVGNPLPGQAQASPMATNRSMSPYGMR